MSTRKPSQTPRRAGPAAGHAARRRGGVARRQTPVDPIDPIGPGTSMPAVADDPIRHDWRDEAMSASALNVLAGLWLIISPWIVGYTSADAWWNPIVFGAIVAVLALVRAFGALRAEWITGANMLIGVWLFVSAFWLAVSSQASWNVGILGVIVFVLAAWSLWAGRSRGPAAAPMI